MPSTPRRSVHDEDERDLRPPRATARRERLGLLRRNVEAEDLDGKRADRAPVSYVRNTGPSAPTLSDAGLGTGRTLGVGEGSRIVLVRTLSPLIDIGSKECRHSFARHRPSLDPRLEGLRPMRDGRLDMFRKALREYDWCL